MHSFKKSETSCSWGILSFLEEKEEAEEEKSMVAAPEASGSKAPASKAGVGQGGLAEGRFGQLVSRQSLESLTSYKENI